MEDEMKQEEMDAMLKDIDEIARISAALSPTLDERVCNAVSVELNAMRRRSRIRVFHRVARLAMVAGIAVVAVMSIWLQPFAGGKNDRRFVAIPYNVFADDDLDDYAVRLELADTQVALDYTLNPVIAMSVQQGSATGSDSIQTTELDSLSQSVLDTELRLMSLD